MAGPWDVVIVGGGHNGLAAATSSASSVTAIKALADLSGVGAPADQIHPAGVRRADGGRTACDGSNPQHGYGVREPPGPEVGQAHRSSEAFGGRRG
jgi:hypothetical protein